MDLDHKLEDRGLAYRPKVVVIRVGATFIFPPESPIGLNPLLDPNHLSHDCSFFLVQLLMSTGLLLMNGWMDFFIII